MLVTGRLVLGGAPLGNPGDATTRLVQALGTAEVIAAEDTRRLHRLAKDLGVTIVGRVVSYFEGNEERRTPDLVADMESGATVLLITDAGMPSVSDPGYRLVVAALEAGVPVSALPGPSAVTTALALSGLPCDRFCFEGFPPRKSGERRAYFSRLADEPRTLVFFESPRRIGDTLADMAQTMGADRPAAVCRELTKTYEEVRRGTLAELAEWASDGLLGEITVVVGGAPPRAAESVDATTLAADVAVRESAGMPRKEAIAEVAVARRVPKREVFDAVVAAKSSL